MNLCGDEKRQIFALKFQKIIVGGTLEGTLKF